MISLKKKEIYLSIEVLRFQGEKCTNHIVPRYPRVLFGTY